MIRKKGREVSEHVIWLLPYITINKSLRVGNFLMMQFRKTDWWPSSILPVWHDGEGKQVRRPTVIFCESNQADPESVDTELDLTVQAIAYVILDERMRKRPRPLALLKVPRKELALDRFLGITLHDISRRSITADNFTPQMFEEREWHEWDDELSKSPKKKEYVPSYVRVVKVNTSYLGNDPLYSALLECLPNEDLRFILTAIKWFNLSTSSSALLSTPQRLLFRCIAFEVLLKLPREGKSEMFSHAVQTLIPDVPCEGLSSWASSFYSKRNQVVHAGMEVSSRIRDRYGSDLLLSEIIFSMCLKAKLFLQGLFEYSKRERELMKLRLGPWLMSNKERCEAIKGFEFQKLVRNRHKAYEFVRYLDGINLEDMELHDADIYQAQESLRGKTLRLIKDIEKKYELTSDEKTELMRMQGELGVVDLSYTPSSYAPDELAIPGYPKSYTGFVPKSRDRYLQEEFERQERRARLAGVRKEKSFSEIRKMFKGTERQKDWFSYLPLPYVSLSDLCCAIHDLNELRKALFDKDVV